MSFCPLFARLFVVCLLSFALTGCGGPILPPGAAPYIQDYGLREILVMTAPDASVTLIPIKPPPQKKDPPVQEASWAKEKEELEAFEKEVRNLSVKIRITRDDLEEMRESQAIAREEREKAYRRNLRRHGGYTDFQAEQVVRYEFERFLMGVITGPKPARLEVVLRKISIKGGFWRAVPCVSSVVVVDLYLVDMETNTVMISVGGVKANSNLVLTPNETGYFGMFFGRRDPYRGRAFPQVVKKLALLARDWLLRP